LEIKKIDINLLKPNNYNPNKIENGKLKCLKDKIIKDGYLQPILVRKKEDHYEIIDGYHRWLCCKEAGYTEIECVIVDVNDRNAKLLTLAMNNLRGSSEEDLLKKVIEDLEKDMDLSEICLETGFSKKELEKLLDTKDINEQIYKEEIEKGLNLFDKIDIFITTPTPPRCCYASELGFKIGGQSPIKNPCKNCKIDFIDNEFKNYDHETHLRTLEIFKPKYATVRDYIPKDQCKIENIKYYSLEQILNWAEEIQSYVENVIVIPKDESIIEKIPEEYILGFSVPTTYAGTEISIEKFRDRRVHILGGSPEKQYKIYQTLKDDIVSLDNNYIQSVSNKYCYILGRGALRNIDQDIPYYDSLENVNLLSFAINLHILKAFFSGKINIEGGDDFE